MGFKPRKKPKPVNLAALSDALEVLNYQIEDAIGLVVGRVEGRMSDVNGLSHGKFTADIKAVSRKVSQAYSALFYASCEIEETVSDIQEAIDAEEDR